MGTKNISCGAERQPVHRADKLTARNEYQEYFLMLGKAATFTADKLTPC
jgi:hypothetical protein